MHDWIGGVDINSLYPSVIRALNMSTETIVGQIKPEATDQFVKAQIAQKKSFADAWNSVFGTLEYQAVMEQNNTPVTIQFEDGNEVVVTAKEVYDLVWNNGKQLTLSANGTIFDYGKQGLIPGVLTDGLLNARSCRQSIASGPSWQMKPLILMKRPKPSGRQCSMTNGS